MYLNHENTHIKNCQKTNRLELGLLYRARSVQRPAKRIDQLGFSLSTQTLSVRVSRANKIWGLADNHVKLFSV